MKKILYLIRIIIIAIGISTTPLTHAETVKIIGLVIEKSTPEDVLAAIKKISPTAQIDNATNKTKSITAEKFIFEGRTYKLKASFDENSGKQILSSLSFSSPLNSNKKSSLLNGFKSQDNNGEYLKSNILAIHSKEEKTENIRFSLKPEETILSRIITTVMWIAIAATALIAFASLKYLIWWLIGAALGYIFGNIFIGLIFGAIAAIIHMFSSKSNDSRTYYSQSSDDSFETIHQINPANGMPMNGGVDIYGNHAGSDTLGPH